MKPRPEGTRSQNQARRTHVGILATSQEGDPGEREPDGYVLEGSEALGQEQAAQEHRHHRIERAQH